MSKELYVSSTPHQTKVALVENDQLAEVYFERENEYTLAGSIYKGRVTRVLPGMQSAFVDIGLERDAFLYVSDFFELEDEDETFDPIPAGAAKPFQAQPEPRPEPIVLTSPEEGGEEPEAAAHEATGTNGAAEGSREDDGNRRWRGRNRRRRGRRGFPENKFAQPEHQQSGEAESEEAEDEAEAPPPIVLPGESLAKFNRRRERPVETEAASPVADEQIADERVADEEESEIKPSAEATPEVAATPEAPIRREQPKAYEPIMLPGESLAKYNRNRGQKAEDAATAAKEEPAGEAIPAPRARESRREEYRPYAPIVLPGESISKYRNKPAPVPAPIVAEEKAEENTEAAESVAAEARVEAGEENGSIAAPVEHVAGAETSSTEPKPEALNWWQEADGKDPGTEYEQEQHVESASGAVESEPEQQPEERVDIHEAARAHESETEHHPEQTRPSRFGRMKAFIFGEEEPTRAREESPRHEENRSESAVEAEHHEEHTASTSMSFEGGHESEVHSDFEGGHEAEVGEHVTERPEPDYRNAPLGAFEEEVIEGDEEEDIPHPSEVLYEPDSYEEMEEETLERAAMAADDIVDELEEDETNGYATGEENGEEAEPAEEPELAARAETRGPSGTAGFQRAPRPEYDRNHRRGRRGGSGGRRMQRGGPRREQSRPTVMISDVLKEGQEVLVQIAKEPIGKKGARITSHIALPGRFLVYMPSVNHTGVSRKIASDEERQRLKRIVNSERENGHGGFIVRTAAAGIAEDELRADIRFLKSLWNDIKSRADSSKPPALIYHDLNLVERTLRDLVTEDFSAIWVDTEPEYERVVRFVNRFQSSLTRRVKLYSKDTPLFEQFGVEEEINKALRSKVWLKSGGYIVINQTEALVAIDINTGKYVGKTTRLEDTIFKTNLDAIKEIVRQIRLRDLGGIIVIDFIDMDERRNRQKIMQALEEELQNDRAPSKVLQFNDFGLVAITRKRVKQSLERTLGSPCPYCSANGYVKSPQTVCNEIYTEMRKMQRHFENDVTLRVNPEVAKELKANNGKWLGEMEELTGHNILVKADPTLHQEQFDM
jgi:Rne/Rng family ribonuclease